MSKQYGLILPNKDRGHKLGQVSTLKPSVFNDDSDSDTPTVKPTGITRTVKKQDILNQKKAIEEDPTVYQYDEIYDKMEQEQIQSKLSRKDLDKKPKYIGRLLATAEKRKRENERRIERQVQKEREQEGEQFKDKESFVTSAYKKKLEEMRKLEEEEKREEYLEQIGDVTKQCNLDGFYRHLYDQKVNYEDKLKAEEQKIDVEVKKEPEDADSKNDEGNSRKRNHSRSPRTKSSESPSPKRSSSEAKNSENKIQPKRDIKSRKYRKRKESDDEDHSDGEREVKKEHLPSNLDADSDFSIDSSDSEEEKGNEQNNKSNGAGANTTEPTEKHEDAPQVKNGETEIKVEEDMKVKIEEAEEKVEVKPKKPKVDIWKKRTVGEKFDEALKRYFERKALREAGL